MNFLRTNKAIYGFVLVVILFISLVPIQGYAQSLSTEFNPIFESLPEIRSIAIQEDGKVLVVGAFNRVNNASINPSYFRNVVRLNSDGTTDSSFSLDEQLTNSNFYEVKNGIDGQIIVESFNGISGSYGIHILDETGKLLENFVLNSSIKTINEAIAFDGGYVVIGFIQNLSGNQLFKLNLDGTINEAFGIHSMNGGGSDKILNINDQEILVASNYTEYDESTVSGIFKVNKDGSLNTDFVVEGGSSVDWYNLKSINTDIDGKIYVTGQFTEYNSTSLSAGIFRLNADGSFDNTFNVNLAGNFTTTIDKLAFDENGKIYCIGEKIDDNITTQRIFSLNADGTINTGFGEVTTIIEASFNQYVALEYHNNQLLLASGFRSVQSEFRLGLAAIELDGSVGDLDPQFSRAPTFTSAKSQTDGKVLVTGDFLKVNGEITGHFVRLNEDGSLDSDFTLAPELNSFLNSNLSSVNIQADGKILVGGFIEDHYSSRVLRLNTSGTLDDTFDSVVSARYVDGGTSNILPLPDGRILIAGSQMFLPGSQETSSMAILNSDGSHYPNFNYTSLSHLENVESVVPLDGGQYLIGGIDFNAGDFPLGFIKKINADGSVDNSFNNQVDLSTSVHEIVIVGENLVFGGSTYLGGSVTDQVSAFISDLDGANFQENLIKASGVRERASYSSFVSFDEDNLLIGGEFSKVNGTEISNLAVVRTNGVVNEDFLFEPSGRVDNILQVDEETILVFGQFASTNNTETFGVFKAKLTNTAPSITGTSSNLSTEEDSDITLTQADFTISDPDIADNDFSLSLLEGENYTFEELTITPAQDFFGTLTVPVIANDGEDDSEPFNIEIEVLPINDAPIIEGFEATVSVEEDTSFELSIDQFMATDVDNDFPNDHTLVIQEGENYTFDGLTVTPAQDFFGTLAINVIIQDSEEATSEIFEASVNVTAINDAPIIEGTTLNTTIDSETSVIISLSDLTVIDVDNNYPDDFTLTIQEGDNYTINGTTVTPTTDFVGSLAVNVTVNDGETDSNTFEIAFTVTEVTSIDLSEVSSKLRLHPNPSTDETTISLENEVYAPVCITIVDRDGKVIDQVNKEKNGLSFEHTIQTSSYAPGLYFIRVAQDQKYRSILKAIIR